VIEVDAGRMVDVVITQGAAIEGLDADETPPTGRSALWDRDRQLKRSNHELD